MSRDTQPSIPSLHDILQEHADAIRADLEALMQFARIEPRFERHGGAMVVVSTRPFSWQPLPPDALPIQQRARARYREFIELLRVLLDGAAEGDVQKVLAACENNTLAAIEQRGPTSRETVGANHVAGASPLGLALSIVERLGATHSDSTEPLLVADTNAFYSQPNLEEWAFDGLKRFTIVLVPAILTEIDRHKDGEHPNPAVVAKAQRLVNQIGEFRRRGRLIDGVTVLRDRIRFMCWVQEPRPERTLGWLDLTRADDRLLASTIDLARTRPLSPVAIVTRDLNLQNKCEAARVHFLPPPVAQRGSEQQ